MGREGMSGNRARGEREKDRKRGVKCGFRRKRRQRYEAVLCQMRRKLEEFNKPVLAPPAQRPSDSTGRRKVRGG